MDKPTSSIEAPPAVQVDSEFCNKCGRIHNLPIEVLARSSADDVAWGIDWGRSGDQTAVSIIKKLPDGSIEVVATEYGPPADDEAVRLLEVCGVLLKAMTMGRAGETYPRAQSRSGSMIDVTQTLAAIDAYLAKVTK